MSSSFSACRRILTIVFLSLSSFVSLWTLLSDLSATSVSARTAHFLQKHLTLTPPSRKQRQNISSGAEAELTVRPPAAPACRSSNGSFDPLQTLATIDLDEQLLSQQASLLLDETWEPSFADRLWNNFLGQDELDRLAAARFRLAKQGRKIPARFASPWYTQRWPRIRGAVKKWVQSRRVYDPNVLFSLLMSVKAPIDEHFSKLPLAHAAEEYGYTAEIGKPFRSCAVVGNSGALLDEQYGPDIDAHEAVIRLNNARIAGFEKHVGSKTTLSFLNSNVLQACAGQLRCFCHPYGDHVPTLVYISQPKHFTEVTLCAETRRAPLLVTEPRLDKLCARLAKYYSLKLFVEGETSGVGSNAEGVEKAWSAARDGPSFHYSSGLGAVLVALAVCKEVSLFGFGKGGLQHHYYSSRQQRELHLHDYAAEYQFYLDLQGLSLMNRFAWNGSMLL